MILTLSPLGDPHTANLEVFDDSMSWLHVAWGLVAGLQDPVVMAAMMAAFTGYQVSQAQDNEPWQRTGGEFLEMAVGLIIAEIVKRN